MENGSGSIPNIGIVLCYQNLLCNAVTSPGTWVSKSEALALEHAALLLYEQILEGKETPKGVQCCKDPQRSFSFSADSSELAVAGKEAAPGD